MSLADWGWDEGWARAFAAASGAGASPARVIEERRAVYKLVLEGRGPGTPARVPGALRHKAKDKAALPAVGDWVAAEPSGDAWLVRAVLPRRTKLSRKAAGETLVEQVIAANLDAVFVTSALNQEFNPRRLERFLAVCRESGAEPVLILNKLDACAEPAPYLEQARAAAGGASVVAVSAKSGTGLDELSRWVRPGRTVGFVGSSGVGKSTLINRLMGEEALRTSETRASDERGRHTTTHRQLLVLPGGGVLLDTPGMREMQFWDAERGLDEAFPEIDALAPSCRFKDCAHGSEPGCAVKAAVDAGAIPAPRLESWRKLRQELAARARRNLPWNKK